MLVNALRGWDILVPGENLLLGVEYLHADGICAWAPILSRGLRRWVRTFLASA